MAEFNRYCCPLFFGLVKNHAFHDGNKRTALLTALYHLQKIGRCPNAHQRDFERLTVDIAANQLDKHKKYLQLKKKGGVDAEVKYISSFLRKNTRVIDKAFYSITYQQLDTILRNFGFYLDKPKHNCIDIVKIEKKKSIFFGREKEIKVRVGQIGFPGWTKQVNQGAIKTIRKGTGLTDDKGVDSQSFFKGADSMGSLIDEYRGPLKRLSDK